MASNDDFIGLFMPLQGSLLAFILSMGVNAQDAQDVLQDSAAVMLKKIGGFRKGSSFKAWAFAIVRNEIMHYRRSSARRSMRFTQEAVEDIEQLCLSGMPHIRLNLLQVCVSKLRRQARRLIEMRYFESMSVQEMAARLNRSANSISSTLWKIRDSLALCVQRLERGSGNEDMT